MQERIPEWVLNNFFQCTIYVLTNFDQEKKSLLNGRLRLWLSDFSGWCGCRVSGFLFCFVLFSGPEMSTLSSSQAKTEKNVSKCLWSLFRCCYFPLFFSFWNVVVNQSAIVSFSKWRIWSCNLLLLLSLLLLLLESLSNNNNSIPKIPLKYHACTVEVHARLPNQQRTLNKLPPELGYRNLC